MTQFFNSPSWPNQIFLTLILTKPVKSQVPFPRCATVVVSADSSASTAGFSLLVGFTMWVLLTILICFETICLFGREMEFTQTNWAHACQLITYSMRSSPLHVSDCLHSTHTPDPSSPISSQAAVSTTSSPYCPPLALTASSVHPPIQIVVTDRASHPHCTFKRGNKNNLCYINCTAVPSPVSMCKMALLNVRSLSNKSFIFRLD